MTITPVPATRTLAWLYALSLVVALLLAAASLAGLLASNSLYPTEALRRSFVANDVVNLFIGLPTLLGSLWLAQRGRLIGLLFWPGALFYVTYNYRAYAAAMPLTPPFALYLALVALSAAAIFGLLATLDRAAIRQRLSGAVWERLAGAVLAGLGALFFLRAISVLANALIGRASLATPDLAVAVADLVITPVWVIGGISLWRRQALGYAAGLGLLLQASLLFVALLAILVLQPFLAGTPFPAGDFVVVLVMSLICFIPFVLFARGISHH